MKHIKNVACLVALLILGTSNVFAAASVFNTVQKPIEQRTQAQKLLNLNQASLQQLMKLPGIGEGRARQIMAWRSKRLFRSVEELRKVPGIGKVLYMRLKPYVVIK